MMDNKLNLSIKEISVCLAGLMIFLLLYGFFDFHYAFNHDTLKNSYTYSKIIKEQLLDGVLPIWDHYDAFGSRLLFGEPLDLLFIPLLYFLPEKAHIVVVAYIYLFAGIYFMYIFLCHEGIPKPIGWIGASVWGFNGFFLWHLHELYFHESLIVIPLILLMLRRMYLNVHPFSSWIIIILAHTLQLSTGRVDSVEFTFCIAIFYIMIVLSDRGNKHANIIEIIKLSIIYSTTILCAFALLAPFTFNYFDLINNSSRSVFTPTNYLAIRDFVSIFIPNFSIYGSSFYIPIILLPYVIMAILHDHRIKYYALGLIILHFITAYPFGFWDLVRRLPGHSLNFTVYRTVIFSYFGITLLSVFGLHLYSSKSERLYDWVLIASSVFILLALLGVSIRRLWLNGFPGLVYWHHFIAMFSASIILIVTPKIKRILSPKNMNLFLLIVIGAYVIFFNSLFDINDTSDGDLKKWESNYFESTKSNYVKELKKRLQNEPLKYRVIFRGFDAGLDSIMHALNSMESLNFFNTFPGDAIGMIATKVLGASKCRNTLETIPSYNKFYSLGSVRYIVSNNKDKSRAGVDSSNVVYSDEEVFIKENPNVFERIRFLDNYKVIKSLEETIDFIVQTPLYWFKSNFISEETIKLQKGKKESLHYTIIKNKPNHFKIKVKSSSESVMILNNTYDKGWTIKINGREEPIYRVNAYFIGIKIHAGDHEYDLKYLPPHLLQYILISLVTMLTVAGVCRFIYLKKYKPFLGYHLWSTPET